MLVTIKSFFTITLIATVWAECDPRDANLRKIYCTDKQNGFDAGVINFFGSGCLSTADTGRECPCTCYSYSGAMKKCKSEFDESKEFCYNREIACGASCPFGTEIKDCGCDATSWVCTPGTCTACPANSYYIKSDKRCQTCQTCSGVQYTHLACSFGTDAIAGWDTACVDCPAGSICNNGKKEECPAGSYCEGGRSIGIICDTLRAEICIEGGLSAPVAGCAKGHYFSPGTCTPCQPGTYLAGDRHQTLTCSVCPAGTYQPDTGGTACISCDVGLYSPGTGATACQKCNSGSYQSNTGQSECVECSKGSFTSSRGSSTCTLCEAGTYSSGLSSTVCAQCQGRQYSETLGSTSCSTCPQNMTIFGKNKLTEFEEVLTLHGSRELCDYCPAGRYTCNCDSADAPCISNVCGGESLCPPCSIQHYCPEKGQKLGWTQHIAGDMYISRRGNSTHDNVLAKCTKCLEETQYASPVCTTSNAVCKNCLLDNPLITYISQRCTSTTNTLLSQCNISNGDLRSGIGICNMCPPGSSHTDESGCRLCLRNTFSRGGGECTTCPVGTGSAQGASMCTIICPGNGKYSPNGSLSGCIPIQTSTQQQVIAQWSKLMIVEFGVQLANKATIVATNSANGNGLLWKMEMDQAWILFGDEGGVGDRSLGRITSMSLLPPQPLYQIILVADVQQNDEIGRIQYLTYDFFKGQIVNVATLGSKDLQWPSGLALSDGSIFVADTKQHCIFKIKYHNISGTGSNYAQVLWRGTPGLSSLTSIRNKLNTVWWLLTGPQFMVPFPGSDNLMILMDDVGIWTFRTDQPISNTNDDLSYVCGGISISTSVVLLCREINFQALGVTGLVATRDSLFNVMILVSFRTTDENCGVLSLTQNLNTFDVQMLIPGFSSALFRYQQFPTSLYLGNSNHGVFATLGGNIAQVVEIGMGACLCDAGLYCDTTTQSCVQSPVGSYSPSWSSNPIPCNIGTISRGPGGKDEASWCRPCGRNEFTTKKAGALSCEPMCALNTRFSAEVGECVEGCDAAIKGEYLDFDEVTCRICPIGSGAVLASIGKGVTAGCPPCQPAFQSTKPGICEPCPPLTTSIFFGATICMPSTATLSSSAADGISPPERNDSSKSYPVFAGSAVITSMSVTSGGSIFLADEMNVVWKINRAKTLPLAPVRIATLCSSSVSLSLIEVSDDGTTLFSTEIGGTCIRRISLNSDYGYETEVCPLESNKPWAGVCGLSGDKNGQSDVARLGFISSIALMHVEGHTPVLFVSTRSGLGFGCTSIRSISLYDGSITTFLSYDQLQFPFVLVPICHDLEYKLSIPRGTDKIFYSNGGDVTLIELYNGNQTLNNNYGMVASLIFSLNGQGTVWGMASKADGTLVILKEKVGKEDKVDLIIIGPRIWTNGNSDFVNTVDQVAAAGGMLACAGQHIWYTDVQKKSVYESSSSLLSGCIGGFVRVNSGVCMQVGIGQYSTPDGVVQNCKGGTYGTVGGSLHISCKDCPPGSISKEGALGCEVCPASKPFASHGSTECTAVCPISTYVNDGARICISCPAGFFGPIGAISSKECTPCDAGSYTNESTNGLCEKCPIGWSSVSGASGCVVVCSPDKCASDGLQCKPLTSNWELVTSIFIPQGFSMRAVAVSRGGGVFYSDNNLIQYFLDDCPAYTILENAETCSKQGFNILPPLCSGCTRGITAMVVSQELAKGTSHRYLYATSMQTHNVYRFPIIYAQGIVDADATLQRLLSDRDSTTAAFSDVWLVIGNVNGMSGFADGPFLNFAKFNTPMELDISQDDRFLVISDFNNNRIRLADFKHNNVSTILGTGGSCWKRGTTSACLLAGGGNPCNIPSCACSKNPIGIGLSASGETLFVAMNNEDSIASLSSPLTPNVNREFGPICALSLSKATSGSIETCQTSDANSKSCMLFQPYDVIAESNNVIYASVKQGITRIDLNSRACQQIAGSYWDFTRTSRGYTDGPVNANTQTSDARVYQPFRLALAKDRGILYVADMNNGALRRVFLGGRCTCPAGSIYLPESQSCYNPSQKWSTRTLVQCPAGQYALEGESFCKNCSDAEVLGIHTTTTCIMWKNTQTANANMKETGFSYAKVIGSPQNPLHNVVGSDWYGSGYVTSPSWDDIFRIDSIVKYGMGKAPGHAPWGGEFGSYTYNAEFNTWALEENPMLKPNLLLPGLWHPCSPGRVDSTNSVCDCSNQVASFDVEQGGGLSSNSPWHNIRIAAFEAGAKVLLGGSTLKDYASGLPNDSSDSALSLWSRFMILGSDMNSPTVCPSIGGSGPCFPVFQHVKTSVVTGPLLQATLMPKYITLNVATANGIWNKDGITTLICATGWPAHYSCPNGYTWVAPNSSHLDAITNVILNKVTSQIACLSCIPGTFSFMDTEIKKITGGPYSCLRCVMGTFSSAVGSTSCIQCPSATYASMHGATTCNNCPDNYWTKGGAQTIDACSPCPPGSGNCKTCVYGEYQSMSAQQTCIKCPPGQVSNTVNQTTCTPCSPQTYQPSFGMAYCDPCPHGSFAGQSGATTCTTCDATAACKLTVGGICGQGCGLNFYFDENQCKRCPAGYLNANDPCSQYITSCFNPIPGKYATEQLVGGDIISECPYGFGPNDLLRGCSPCPAGTYAVLGRGICEKCPAGYFSTQLNQSSCSSCPAGSFALDKGQTGCLICEKGYYSPISASVRCTECSPGHYASSSGSSLCTPCGNGTYQNINASISPCEKCNADEGFYSGSAATVCRYCEGGYVNLSQSSSCVGCGLGMYEYEDDLGTRRCKQCEAGLVNLYERFAFNKSFCQPCPSYLDYSPANSSGDHCFTSPPGNVPTSPLKTWFTPCLPGTFRGFLNDSCLPCPQGHVAVTAGLQECVACIPGTFAHPNGKKCISCDNGLFSSGFAAVQCVSCPAGSISSDTHAACIPCAVNTFHLTGGTCQQCEFGTISLPGSTQCQACPVWTIYNTVEQTCSGCRAGTYMAYEAAKGYFCQACRLGTQNTLSGANSSSACTPCGAGFIPTSTTAATGCMTCPLGQREINNISCEKCAVGKIGPNGIICSSCSIGTYASSEGSSACRGCSVGSFSDSTETRQCSLCQVGTFSNVTGSTACLTCTSAEDGYAPTTGLSSCIPRKKTCSPLHYLKLKMETPNQDNECIYCNECASDEYVIPTQDDIDYLVDLVLGAGRLLNSCPGNTTSPGYRCLKNEPVVGMFLSDRSRAGSSSGSSSSSGIFQDQSPCTDLTADDLIMMDYVLGPTSDCYVGCRYGVVLSGSQGGVYQYTNLYGGNGFESPMGNIFYPRLAPMASEVCARCPLSPCPLNTYRPEYLPGCGPPCGLNPYKNWCMSSGHVNNQGCYLTCKNPPMGAVTSGGSVSGLGTDISCPWTCLHGWHINENGTGCTPCTTNICESGFVLVSQDQCLTHHTKTDLCKPCPSIEGGNAVGWKADTSLCIYSCFTGYYNGLQRCISCTSLPDCPIGTYRNVEDCINRGVEPLCLPCRFPQDLSGDLISFTTHGGFLATNCSALCRTGYHTIDKKTGTYISNTLGFGIVSPDITCRLCIISESRPCNGKCSSGYFRNTSISSDTMPGSCVKCVTNQECGPGRYAPMCSGNGTANVGCHDCNPALLLQNGEIVRQFVPYEDQIRLITTGIVYPSAPFACPSACVANFIQDLSVGGGGSQCISCRSYTQQMGCRAETLLPSAYAPMQPTPCDFVFSHWNATPSLVWWDNTPSFLPSSFSKGVTKRRAGLCWACPMGTGTLQQDPDLCLILPGYGRPSATPLTERIAIPILGPDLYLSFQEPRPLLINLLDTSYNMGGRRLLSQPSTLEKEDVLLLRIDIPGAESARVAAAAVALGVVAAVQGGGVLCPVGAYKNGRGSANCLACPYGTSTISSGSFHVSQCLCNPGWFRVKSTSIDNNTDNSHMECIPCSIDTFRPAGTVGEGGCLMCPQNETTHGRKNSTACACKPGFVRNNQLLDRSCVPCAAGMYCSPCFEGQQDCPLEGVQAVACFAHSSSPPGSTSIKNCSCLSGLIPLTRTTNRQAYYCAPVPPNAIYDQVSKMVRCKLGWTEIWSLGQLSGCTLCPMGYFADADPSILAVPLICRPCPKGTFAASKDMIGNCTACLSPQTTVSEASKSPESCGCPLPTSKGPDGNCIGCLSNQYILSGICTNCPLFSISKIGASARSDCLCMPGYGVETFGSCSICDVGKYSSSASNNPCKPCPEGSTTQNLGSKTVRNCGATADLCLPGYTVRTNLGCVLTSLLLQSK